MLTNCDESRTGEETCIATLKCADVPLATQDWKAFSQLSADCFVHEADWLQNAWEHYHRVQTGVYGDLTALNVTDSHGQQCGLSAWYRQYTHGINWWRQVGGSRICSDYVGLPSVQGHQIQVAQATAKWFASQPRKLLDCPTAIQIEGHRADCPQLRAFFQALEDRGWTQDSVHIESAWRTELPTSFPEYELLVSRNRRKKIRLAIKMRERGELDFAIHSQPAQVEAHWQDFVWLHQNRRQSLGQPGCFADPVFSKFLHTATIELTRKQVGGLAFLKYQGLPLAAVLIFQAQGGWFVYQTGIDSTRLKLQPGHMVVTLMIQEAIRRGIQFIDFMRGDEPYKSGWNCNPVTLCRTILLPPGLASRGIASALKIKRSFSGWLSKSQPKPAEGNQDSE
jgi:CelD/BcsL family acetyltransferase involved in cellulose biosynthesis